jgi:hypothetical protein
MDDWHGHLGSLMTSFANIILQLDAIDESYIDAIERTAGFLFMIFPQLHMSQRKSHLIAFSKLLSALFLKKSLSALLSRIGLQKSHSVN